MITSEQIDTLRRDGFVVLPQLAGRERAETARRTVNHYLGEHGIPPDRLPQFRTQSYCPELRGDPAIVDLIRCEPVSRMIDDLIGLDTLNPVEGGQIALRFPQPPGPGDDEARNQPQTKGYHIDGVPSPNNGVPPGEVHNFVALVGVLLNDQPEPFRGNFRAHPGSHEEMAAYFREHGTDDLAEKGTPRIVTEPARQVTGQAGDVVITNHLTAHGIAPNLSPEVRYNVFFRLWSSGRGKFSDAALKNPWQEWKI